MEYFDLYNKDGKKINKQVLRGTKLQDDEYHLIVHIWIRNNDNLYLIQQRNKEFDKVPYLWAVTAGSATVGDTSIITALRETLEELGISLVKDNMKFLKRYFTEDNYANFITDVYLINQDVLLKDLIIDETEVKDCMYSSIKEIEELVSEGMFWDYKKILKQKGYFDLIEKSW